MEDESEVSSREEVNNPNIFSRNLRITEILKLVLNESEDENEMKSILLNYWDKFDNKYYDNSPKKNKQDEENLEENIQEESLENSNQNKGNMEENIQEEILKNNNQDDEIMEENIQEEILKNNNQDDEIMEENIREETLENNDQDEELTEEDIREEILEQSEEDLEENIEKGCFSEFDFLCTYMLNCVFKKNGPTLTAVSRSLYCYLKCFNLSQEEKSDIIKGRENDFVNALREFTNFDSTEGDNILIHALITSLLHGNYGLSLFLLKFGLVEIPTEVNNKCRKIVLELLLSFNDILYYAFANETPDDERPFIDPDDMLDLMTRSDINIKRTLMTFFAIIFISEFRLLKHIEMNNFKEAMRNKLRKKFACLYEIFDETIEVQIKLKEIQNFSENFLYPLLGEDFGMALVQFSLNDLSEYWDNVNLRKLKDLTRIIIRRRLQKSMLFPEQVNQFDISVDLKEFLLFNYKDIFNLLRRAYNSEYIEKSVRLSIAVNAN